MKIQSPWMGRIKGSAGNMTGCKVYDKNVLRAKAFEVNNPNTSAQQMQRGYFADLTKLVAGFTPDQLRTLFPSKPKAMSRRNALSKQLAESYNKEGNQKFIDFDEIETFGNAPTAPFQKREVTFEGDLIDVEWNEITEDYPQYSQMNVIVGLVNASKQDIKLVHNQVSVEDGGTSIQKPSNWETTDTVYGLIFLADSTANSKDFGSFIIKLRPEKKSN